jgi:hypothetical protein
VVDGVGVRVGEVAQQLGLAVRERVGLGGHQRLALHVRDPLVRAVHEVGGDRLELEPGRPAGAVRRQPAGDAESGTDPVPHGDRSDVGQLHHRGCLAGRLDHGR